MKDLDVLRSAIRPLLAPADPEDALTAYYALFHDPHRTQLTLHRTPSGGVDGFVAVCQTGQSLFRPVGVIRAPNADVVGDLLRRALVPGRPYYLIAPLDMAESLGLFVEMPNPTVNRIFWVDAARFSLTPEINVLVQEAQSLDGQLRWEIRSGGKVAAVAGTNWRSPFCAEVYVYTEPEFRRRGWGRAVVRAATAHLLQVGLLPLYMAEESDPSSCRLAEAAGYSDTGRRELAGEAYLRPA